MKWPSRCWNSDICEMKPKLLFSQAFMDVCVQGQQLRNPPRESSPRI